MKTASTSLAASLHIHEDFLQCLSSHHHNLTSISSVVYTPTNSSYSSVLQSPVQNLRFLSAAVPKPQIIVTPLDESEIQATVCCAKEHGIEVRVRSGGHDYEGLSSISEFPFVIIDMRNFRSITVNAEESTAWVQVGASLGELYYRIAEKSRTLGFPAGTCPTVGAGGHFSGGGYSMMSRKYGMAADHVIDARLVDASGRILDRQSMGEDLFWAIRGGGGASFGVILAWKINLVPVPEKVTVFNLNRTSEQNATALVHRWQYVADKIDDNLLIRLFMSSLNSNQDGKRTVQASFTSLFLGGVDTLLPLMQESFPELGLIKEDCIEMSWVESNLYLAGFRNGEPLEVLLNRAVLRKAYYKGKSDYVREAISVDGLEGLWELLHEEEMGRTQLQFSPYGGRLNEIPESEIPFPHRAGNVYTIHYVVFWGKEEESPRHIDWMRKLYSYMAPFVSKSPRAAYVNYRDLDLGMNKKDGSTSYAEACIWGTKYFKSNFNRLVQVKAMVDPSNFFRNEQSIPPFSSLVEEMS
ncbi:hypothetical protein RJ640_000290 [Escallonia rubra]|uniref:FAD-binding PCMH-type domain-containing protein n=1 Tax=Escallonia rubra TaxID=112253 RepID=A0AA88RAA9_9ASTE|nr:hypothetical protein RJ640_000290 [Escallonia rubra]